MSRLTQVKCGLKASWEWLRDSGNQGALRIVGGVAAAVVGSGFALFTYFDSSEPKPERPERQAKSRQSDDARYALEQLLITCQKGYDDGRKYGRSFWLEQHCFVNPSDAIAVREYWELLGSPQYVELTLHKLMNIQDSVAEGIIISKASGDASHEVRVRFKKTTNGWRVSGNKLFTQ